MKTKAESNLEIAQYLINQKDVQFCTASVHCSYYAVFQYMKYMLAHMSVNPISYEEQKEKFKNESSHESIILEIKNRINNFRDARDFAQDIHVLKKDRVDADYERTTFDVGESLERRQNAVRLISKLKTYFGNI